MGDIFRGSRPRKISSTEGVKIWSSINWRVFILYLSYLAISLDSHLLHWLATPCPPACNSMAITNMHAQVCNARNYYPVSWPILTNQITRFKDRYRITIISYLLFMCDFLVSHGILVSYGYLWFSTVIPGFPLLFLVSCGYLVSHSYWWIEHLVNIIVPLHGVIFYSQ